MTWWGWVLAFWAGCALVVAAWILTALRDPMPSPVEDEEAS